MRVSTTKCGFATMILGGASMSLAILLFALGGELFPIATIIIAGGILVFIVGAVLFDCRSNRSYQDPRLNAYRPDQ